MSLCVTAPLIGSINETYIQKHINDLVPGGAAVITDVAPPPAGMTLLWSPTGPVLFLGLAGRAEPETEFTREEKERIAAFWRLHGVTTVLAQYLQSAVRYVAVAREANVKLYTHAHGLDCSALLRDERWRHRYLELNQATGVIVVSDVMKTRLVDLGIAPEKIHRIPYGVVEREFKPRPQRQRVRFLMVGRMTGKKAPILLLESFRRALLMNPNLELHYVGHGQLFDAVEQFIHVFGMTQNVLLHGGQPPARVTELIDESDVFVQHSITTPSGDEEGLPVGILEAMAGGLPIVSTLHAGIPEAVEDSTHGFLVGERDVDGMAARMIMLAGNHDLRQRMGAAGAKRIQAEFSWPHERQRLRAILTIPDEMSH